MIKVANIGINKEKQLGAWLDFILERNGAKFIFRGRICGGNEPLRRKIQRGKK